MRSHSARDRPPLPSAAEQSLQQLPDRVVGVILVVAQFRQHTSFIDAFGSTCGSSSRSSETPQLGSESAATVSKPELQLTRCVRSVSPRMLLATKKPPVAYLEAMAALTAWISPGSQIAQTNGAFAAAEWKTPLMCSAPSRRYKSAMPTTTGTL